MSEEVIRYEGEVHAELLPVANIYGLTHFASVISSAS